MIDKKPRSLLLTLGAAGLLIVGGGTAYFLQRNAAGTIPVGAEILPQEALLSVSVSTNPSQWRKLQEFGTSETQLAFQQSLSDLQTRYLTGNGFNYQEDIQPWVGDEATITFLPAKQSSTLGTQQSVVWVLPIENVEQAHQTLESKRSQGGKITERTYKGLKIQEVQGTSQGYSAAVLDRLLVLASTPKVMDQVVDTYRGEASLASTPGYRAALGEINAYQPFARMYINLPAAASRAIAGSGRQISPETTARIQETQGLGSTVLLEADSIRFKSISWFKPNSKRKLPVENNAKDLPSRLPENTLMMASGSSFQQVWQEYVQGSESQLLVPFNPNQFQASVQAATGMNFAEDFVDWMDGEFALALLPSEGTSQGVGLVLMAQTSDRDRAERALTRLDSVMRDKFNLNVSESKVDKNALITWKVPPGLPVASHGWLDNVAFLTLGAPIEGAIVPQPKAALTNAALFQAATRSDLNRHSGSFFVDMAQTQTLLDSSPLLPKLTPDLRKFATAIRAIGVTVAVKNARTTRYDVLVKLQRASDPQNSSFQQPDGYALQPDRRQKD